VNRYTMLAAVLAALISLIGAPGSAHAAQRMVVTFTGDIMMHTAVKESAAQNNRPGEGGAGSANNGGFDFLFDRIRPHLADSDVVLGNMEFPVSPPFRHGKGVIFNCAPEIIPAMHAAGFTLFTLANNHILDQGNRGAIDTMDYLQRYAASFIGVNRHEGTARRGIVVQIHGIRVGFLAYTGILNYGFPVRPRGLHVNWLYWRNKTAADIRTMRARCDFVVVVSHAGKEYKIRPEAEDMRAYRDSCEAGADLVIGHHPHVLQPVEAYTAADGRSCRIFYSLGNFISNQRFKYHDHLRTLPYTTQETVLVRLVLERAWRGGLAARYEVLPLWTENEIYREDGRERRRIQVWRMNERIEALERDGATGRAAYLRQRLDDIPKILFPESRPADVTYVR